MESKEVTWRNLKKGQEISGYTLGGCIRMFTGFVKDANPAYVTISAWSMNGKEERVSSEAMFSVKMTEEEFRKKYESKAKEIVRNIQKRLNHDEIGYKEMWNSWLYGDPYEMAADCSKHGMTVVGHCRDITPKKSWMGDDVLDVGVCCEYEDGERFWCHFRSGDIARMLNRYKHLAELTPEEEWENAFARAEKILRSAGAKAVIEKKRRAEYKEPKTGERSKGVFIERFPVIGNKELIERLNGIDAFFGKRELSHDGEKRFYTYGGYLILKEHNPI